MVGGGHSAGAHAQRFPEGFHGRQGGRIRSLSRRQDAKGVLKEVRPREFDASLFAASHRMTADKMNALRQDFVSQLDHRRLRTPHIRYDRTWPEEFRQAPQYFIKSPHRCA
jgi:hypothetical protein